MKTASLWFAVLFASLTGAWAGASSVKIKIELEQQQFLPNEDLPVAVHITNQSGQTLHLGEEGWLRFYVEATDNFIVQKNGNPPVAGEFPLDSSMVATKRANLTPYFDLQKPGRYRVMAKLKLPQWNEEIVSPMKTFDIVKGTRLQVVEFGVPSAQSSDAAPEMRKYILQQASYSKEMKLYLRVTDANEGKVFKVFPIAKMLSFSHPEAQLDRFSNLHVLHLIGQKSFNYSVINPDGQTVTRQRYDFNGDSRPRLRMEDDGKIILAGGVRHVSANDLPPTELPTISK